MAKPSEVARFNTAIKTANEAAIAEGAEMILASELVVFPTETVYGLGANALNDTAVRKIFIAKGRPANDPLIVHICTVDQLHSVAAHVSEGAKMLIDHFWPGPLTLIFPKQPVVPSSVTAGLSTVAVRMPSHPIALALLRKANCPIAAPSANIFTHTSPTTAHHALADLNGRVGLILDDGPTKIGVESTIVDLTNEPPRLLRPGGVPFEDLQRFVPNLVAVKQYHKMAEPSSSSASATTEDASNADGPVCPGLLVKHYSPKAIVHLYEGPVDKVHATLHKHLEDAKASKKSIGLLVCDQDLPIFGACAAPGPPVAVAVVSLGPRADASAATHSVFAGLRHLDSLGVTTIVVHLAWLEEGLGAALRDRLFRAAEGRLSTLS